MSTPRGRLHAAPAHGGRVEPGARVHRRPARTRRPRRRSRLAGLIRFAVFLLLIFLAVWAGVRVAHAGADATLYTGQEYTVQSGDTLWEIAEEEYGSSIDLRAAVYEIRVANDLGGAVVHAGQKLTLPYLGD